MHISLMLSIVLMACCLRWYWQPGQDANWPRRWHWALVCLCLPLLWLGSTLIAILWMGHQGQMMGLPVSATGCWISRGLLIGGAGLLIYLIGQAFYARYQLGQLPVVPLDNGELARQVPTDTLTAARIGLWNPDLVVSRGLMVELTPVERQAVLSHEQAHFYYQDPFWFFWLGWVRRLTLWLPHTQDLWNELLLLREIRADLWALKTTEAIVLAEVILKMTIPGSSTATPDYQTACSPSLSVDQLSQRVEALLCLPTPETWPSLVNWYWLLLGMLPLLTVLLHD